MNFTKPVFRMDREGNIKSRYVFEHTDPSEVGDLAAVRALALAHPLFVDWVALGENIAYEWIFDDTDADAETVAQFAISYIEAVKFDHDTSERFIRKCISTGLVGDTLLARQDGGPDYRAALTTLVSEMNAPVIVFDEVDWVALGEFRSVEIIMDSFDRDNGSSLLTLRMFHAAITAFSKSDSEIALELIRRMEELSAAMLEKHLRGIGLDLKTYAEHDGQFTRQQARHLSDYSRWRFRLITEEFPGSLRTVLDLTMRDLSTSPASVRDVVARHQ